MLRRRLSEQTNVQKTALAKGEKMKSADAVKQILRAAELARMTVERESKVLNDLQEQLVRHRGKKPKKSCNDVDLTGYCACSYS